jgi:hypothetical protein
MQKWLRTTVGALLIILIFLAWADGRGSASDFATSAGRVTGDVVSAIVDFFHGLSDNKPSSETQ